MILKFSLTEVEVSGDLPLIMLMSQEITFVAYQAEFTLQLFIPNDSIANPNRVATLTLSNPSAGFIGAVGSTTVTIIDDDTTFTDNERQYC